MMSSLLSAALLSMAVTSSPVASQAQSAASVSGQAGRQFQSLQRFTFRGRTSIGRVGAPRAGAMAAANAAAKSGNAALEVRRSKRGHTAADVKPAMFMRNFAAAAARVALPSVSGRRVVAPDPGFFGFAGLTHADQRLAGTGIYTNTQFSLEPPDQALCVGNGFVVEAVNNAISVYTNGGGLVSGPTPMSAFFGLAPEIVRPSGPYGPFISDPKCYFDRDTQRWFVTELEFDTNPSTGAASGPSSTLVAVSQTPNPLGAFNVLSFDTTDRSNPGCPCFGDQPLIGADANGFYISTNEFPQFNPGFNGAQVYAFSKIALALGIFPTVVHFDTGALATPDPGGTWYSIQPATTPDLNRAHPERNGTEFFLSSLDFFNAGDHRIATWSLSGTATLFNPTPKVALQNVVIPSQAYGPPPNAVQKPGPTPLGTSLGEPLITLQSNDDRMNQVVFANGALWSGVNTAINTGGTTTAGNAFFAVQPSFVKGKLAARVVRQGYVAVTGQNTIFPSIGVNASGKAILTCTLVGPNYFPSVAYVPVSTPGYQSVRLAGPGALPDDGFTGYKFYGGNGAGRWGDYSAAVADERGNIWIAAEYIPDNTPPNPPRTPLANWGTFIGSIPF